MMIAAIIESLDADVLLIPHVVCQNPIDDDEGYLLEITRYLPAAVARRVDLLDNPTGFLAVKEELRRCDCVVAARMHCAISRRLPCNKCRNQD
jgi:polysaccharide pyruvyl transferase WcaK-like protein